MKKSICLLLIPLVFASCSVSRQMMRYAGKIQFFLPNGEVEEYDAEYVKTFETKGGRTRINEALNLNIGANIVIAKDIPSFFVGSPVGPGMDTGPGEPVTVDTPKGRLSYNIPLDEFQRIVREADGNEDRIREMLGETLYRMTGERYPKDRINFPTPLSPGYGMKIPPAQEKDRQ